MEGYRHSVTSADGTRIGLLTAGAGPALLLVHGGMGRIEIWQPLWGELTSRWRVTAMDRRSRGTSGDTEPYDLSREFTDVATVAASLAGEVGAGKQGIRTRRVHCGARRMNAPSAAFMRCASHWPGKGLFSMAG